MSATTRYFTGEYEHAIDSVNRLVIPAKWRTGASEELFLMARDEGSLAVFTVTELEKIKQEIDSKADLTLSEKRNLKQQFSSNLCQVTCDKQGRITVDAALMKKVKLKESVVFVGGIERFEIWNLKAWEKRKQELSTKVGTWMSDLGI